MSAVSDGAPRVVVVVTLALCALLTLCLVFLLLSAPAFCSSQITTEKHRMSFPETVDEILDVSEDEGGMMTIEAALCRFSTLK